MIGCAHDAVEFKPVGRAQRTCGNVEGVIASFEKAREVGPHFLS